jgi:hypothetical protein
MKSLGSSLIATCVPLVNINVAVGLILFSPCGCLRFCTPAKIKGRAVSHPVSKKQPQTSVWGCWVFQEWRLLAKIFKGDALSFHEQANAIKVFVKDRTNATPVVEAFVTESVCTCVRFYISGEGF